MIISPRDNYEDIFSLYQKGGLFDVIERYQVDSKSQFAAFKAILFRIEQCLKRNSLIKNKYEEKIVKLNDDLHLAKSEVSKDIESQKHHIINYLLDCLKSEREIFIQEREIFRSLFFKDADIEDVEILKRVPYFEKSFLGKSKLVKSFFDETIKAISSGNNILIYGKSGIEIKDLATFVYIFRNLPYEVPFIELDCALISKEDFETEAFGQYKRILNNRYVTNEGKQKIGKLEQANQGFLFINHIEQLSISNQELLFKALKNGYMIPVGGSTKEHWVEIDFNLIVGSVKNLHTMINKGEFKWHLLNYIMQGEVLKIPMFHERLEDFKFIFHYSLINSGANIVLDESAIEYLSKQEWPDGVISIEHFVNVYLQNLRKPDFFVIDCFEIEKLFNNYMNGFSINEDKHQSTLYQIHLNTKTISTVRKNLDFLEKTARDYFIDFDVIKVIDLDKLAYREFHTLIAEKKSSRGRKRINECMTVNRYKTYKNGKVNQQRLAIKYLFKLHPEKWSLLRRVTFFNEILAENSEVFRNGSTEAPVEKSIVKRLTF
ncbi:sigma 54-interacting transcriptional regulator [Emticicia sp. C21]|uniref:sigma 54-interacting transcriptional regulator n=1 Tax=Emticicia sp. C21 TaxID=2302915 RepID=UPI001314786B|nr:sigma 54-interacting transcriptional regulator [Emticicia sp. C21]